MSELAGLLTELRHAQIRLWLDEGRVRYRAPTGAMTPDLLAALRERQGELRDWLDRSIATAIPHISDAASYEASNAQQRLWLLHELAPDSAAYNVPLHQLLEGPLDRTALEHAVAGVITRHEALRTRFGLVDGELRQIVEPASAQPLDYRDLSQHADPEAEARASAQQHATMPFDLATGPLCRAGLLRLSPQRHVLLFTVHHIVADGVSVGVIATDIADFYEAALTGTLGSIEPLALQYRDFAAWQNHRLASGGGTADRDYWHAKLGGRLAVLDLTEDLSRPPVRAFRGREIAVEVSRDRAVALTDLSRRHGASLFMGLVAVLKALLYRTTGEPDIIVGTPVAGRPHADLEEQVGFYLNTLALRDTVAPEMSFAALLATVRATAIEAYDHQNYPFERLVDELNVPRDPSRSPVFDVMVILQNRVEEMASFGGITARGFFQHTDTAKFDLSFNFKEHEGGLLLGIEYDTDLFVDPRIRAMAEQFMTLLDGAIADPDCAVSRLPLLTPQQRRLVLEDFNLTAADYPLDGAVIDLFEAQAQRTPDIAAVRHRGRTLSYAELDAQANRIAHHLSDVADFAAGERALLELPVGFDLMASLLAVLKLRGAAILLEPGLPAVRRAQIVAESASRAMIREGPASSADFPGTVVALEEARHAIEALPADPISNALRTGDDIALVYFTSGSTGRPKGVPIANRALTNLLHWFRAHFAVGPDDILAQKTAVTFVDSMVELLLPVTLASGCVEFPPDDDTKRDPALLAAWLQEIQATLLQFVPAVFDQVAAEMRLDMLRRLRVLILSGAVATRAVEGAFRTYNLYGCSECAALSTHHEMTAAAPLSRIPIGRPLTNTRVYILDPEGEPTPTYLPGEIYIGGAMVAPGYLGDPTLSADRFVPDPLKPGETLFRTGDWGRWLADGSIDYLGRKDQQVKIRGMRIECTEIERVLTDHPALTEALVIGRNGPDEQTELVAYVVPVGGDADSAALRQHLADKLPDPMVPRRFMVLDALPRTASGKIDRNALPDPSPAAPRPAGVAPRDPLEQAIAAVWQDVLGVVALGVHDDFLDLGGHSLTAARIVARLRRDVGAELTMVDLFRSMTIANLAALARTREASTNRIKPIEPADMIAPPTEEELAMLGEDLG